MIVLLLYKTVNSSKLLPKITHYQLTRHGEWGPCCGVEGLSNNYIGGEGVAALADALKTNTSLQCLSLWCNHISDDGVTAMADALRTNNALQTLYLGEDEISDDGAVAMAGALKENTTL
ncbi:hypothetical protein ACHAXM_000208 [Skeletonema potamos]